MDVNSIKKDFPIFTDHKNQDSKGVGGAQPLIYLDNAATTQKPISVIQQELDFYSTCNANVYRGLYELSEEATIRYQEARDTVAQFINARDSSEIIFTKGTTEGINFIAHQWGCNFLQPGDEIVLTMAEHMSNLLPWQRVAKQTGAVLKFIPLEYLTGDNSLDAILKIISSRTKLWAITGESNVIGPVWGNHLENLFPVINRVHECGGVVLLDAAQYVAHYPLDVQRLNIDFLVFSGHKIYGPTGVGVLYCHKKHHDRLEPYQLGGSMVDTATLETAVWMKSPMKYEAGTPPIAQALGLRAALDYIHDRAPWPELAQHESLLTQKTCEGLLKLSGVQIVSNHEALKKHGHLVSFNCAGVHAHDIAGFLAEQNIAVRAGSHCAQPVVQALGFNALVRVSFGLYNTLQDVEMFLLALEKALYVLKK